MPGQFTGFDYGQIPGAQARQLRDAQQVREYLDYLSQGGGFGEAYREYQADPRLFPEPSRRSTEAIQYNLGRMAGPLQQSAFVRNDNILGSALDLVNPLAKVGLLGTLAGPMAKTANPVAMNLAKQMQEQGRSAEDIWRVTAERHGQPWWLGHPDQVPRFEISDKPMQYNPILTDEFNPIITSGRLSETVVHPELMKAYPDLEKIKSIHFRKDPMIGGMYGQYTPSPGGISSLENIKVWGEYSPGEMRQSRSTAGHEIQHAIQQREGMARGGMPKYSSDETLKQYEEGWLGSMDAIRLKIIQDREGMTVSEAAEEFTKLVGRKPVKYARDFARQGNYDEIIKDRDWWKEQYDAAKPEAKYEQYARLGGEMDARAVQTRMNLTPQERADRPFWMDYDRPIEQMIVRKPDRYGQSGAMASKAEGFEERLFALGEKRRQLQKEYFDSNDPELEADLVKRIRRTDAKLAEIYEQQQKQSRPIAEPQAIEEAYKGMHEAPTRSSGAPGNDLTDIYPEDIYGPFGAQYYGHHGRNNPMDLSSVNKIREMKGNPGKPVFIYRAIPKDVTAGINPGDWVTINRSYAKEHGESQFGGDYKIIRRKVKASDIYTNGDSIHEWGFDPKGEL